MPLLKHYVLVTGNNTALQETEFNSVLDMALKRRELDPISGITIVATGPLLSKYAS